ncbi:MAG: hypothetical protein PQJ46_07750 [Spirochaetales bacterium]|nr:hypothetical protein [Spirochaetales bacterium]
MDTLIIIIIATAVIMSVGFYERKKSNINIIEVDNDEEKEDYNQEFIKNSDGKEVIPFVRIFAQSDKLLLRSLLSSENIYTYMTSENTNSLFPGRMIQGYTDMIIYIFKEDKKRAKPIVEDYILNLIENINPEIKVKAMDFISVLALVPTSLNQIIPEILDSEANSSNNTEAL